MFTKTVAYVARVLLIALVALFLFHAFFDREAQGADLTHKWMVLVQTRSDTLEMRYELRANNVIVHLRHQENDPAGEALRLELFQLIATCEPGGIAPARVGIQRHTVFDPVTGEQLADIESPTPDGAPAAIDVTKPIGEAVAMACAAQAYARTATTH